MARGICMTAPGDKTYSGSQEEADLSYMRSQGRVHRSDTWTSSRVLPVNKLKKGSPKEEMSFSEKQEEKCHDLVEEMVPIARVK